MENLIGEQETVQEEIKAEEITVVELEEIFMKCLELEKKHKELKAGAAEVWHQLEGQQLKLGAGLEVLGRTDFTFKYGKFSYEDVQGDLTPKTLEEKEALKAYMLARGIDYDSMVSINAQTLKSFCKEERNLAEERGEMLMQIPGVGLGAVTRKFKMKQTKQIGD